MQLRVGLGVHHFVVSKSLADDANQGLFLVLNELALLRIKGLRLLLPIHHLVDVLVQLTVKRHFSALLKRRPLLLNVQLLLEDGQIVEEVMNIALYQLKGLLCLSDQRLLVLVVGAFDLML